MTDVRRDPSSAAEARPSAQRRDVAGLVGRVRRLPAGDGASRTEGAVQDDLTGPLSRRRMHQAIDQALTHLRDGGEPSAVLLVDVDVPEGSGERMLGIAAGRLTASLRPEDLVGHYGDDLFVVVARDVSDEAAAHKVAARLTRTLEAADDEEAVHVRIGLSMVLADDRSVGDVVARAAIDAERGRASRETHDYAKAYAERNKANRDAAGAAVTASDASRLSLVEAAFDRSSIVDFDVCYQPIADLRGGSVAAIEASLRWQHADLGMIDPQEFLRVAEQRGQMATLGNWAIEKACVQTARWPATRDGRPMRTCVRVSTSQLTDPTFFEHLQWALALGGASGQQLALALAPDALGDASPELLERLADARIALILDHPAADAPSPSAVANLPVSMLRLDRSFATSDPAATLRRCAELGRNLELPLVVQGIETREHLRAVVGAFPLGQGRLFARPQGAAAIEELIRRERPFAALLRRPPSSSGCSPTTATSP